MPLVFHCRLGHPGQAWLALQISGQACHSERRSATEGPVVQKPQQEN